VVGKEQTLQGYIIMKYKPGDLLVQEYPPTPTGYYFVVEIVDNRTVEQATLDTDQVSW
jgi:hypothetical protein